MVAGFVSILLSSCPTPASPAFIGDNSNEPGPEEVLGLLSITLYGISPLVPEERYEPSAKAFLIADRVRLTYIGPGIDKEKIIEVDSFYGHTEEWFVPIGGPSTLKAYIYNYEVSTNTGAYTVSGETSNINVSQSETVDVTVTCVPRLPTYLDEDEISSSNFLTTREEKWYRIRPTTHNTIITLTSYADSDTGLYVYDRYGLALPNGQSDIVDDPVDSVTVVTNPANVDYFVGVIEWGSTVSSLTDVYDLMYTYEIGGILNITIQ